MGEGREDFKVEEVASGLLRVFEERILPRLLNIADESKRYLLFAGWLNTFLEERGMGRIIITGGFAVEVYTGRVYRTMDVDVIVEGDARIVESFLAGFSERIGRGFLPTHDVLSLKSIDIVSTVYNRGKPPVKILVEEYHVYLDPVEDLIAIYLDGWKNWGSTEDRDKAIWLMATWANRLDFEYLEEICRNKCVVDKLVELKQLLSM
ncbi:MAG: hypothetical protein ACO2OS_07990 [Thermosphaera aggregans]|jgi:hypothetical protein|uniref:hypothetical protein n=1 Tax=Thermosphaera aggregans TaxID=54254 RepID=UPI003C01CF5A